jgi:hypothetical protein
MKKPVTVGWREWVRLPELGIAEMKAKIDTGAATAALHALDIEHFDRDGTEWVRFVVHPRQRRRKPSVECEVPSLGRRKVRNPGGRTEERTIIRTLLILAGAELEATVGLTDRYEMGFRMLLGRRTLRGHFTVDPGRSYLGPRPGPNL